MGIAAIETRDHTQIKQDPPSMFLYSQGCLVKPVAHQDARLNPPTAVWWPSGCPVTGSIQIEGFAWGLLEHTQNHARKLRALRPIPTH